CYTIYSLLQQSLSELLVPLFYILQDWDARHHLKAIEASLCVHRPLRRNNLHKLCCFLNNMFSAFHSALQLFQQVANLAATENHTPAKQKKLQHEYYLL